MKDKDMEEIAKIIYEATRIEAEWSKRRIVPEKWDKRDEAFRKQFIAIIDKYLKQDKLPTPKEAHDSWMESYNKMGWKYGKERNTELKTHPDMLPYEKLPQDEKDKDAIFLAFVWVAKTFQSAVSRAEKRMIEKIEDWGLRKMTGEIRITKEGWNKIKVTHHSKQGE